MNCPNCNIENQESAQRCVCGYDFKLKITFETQPKRNRHGFDIAKMSKEALKVFSSTETIIVIILVVVGFLTVSHIQTKKSKASLTNQESEENRKTSPNSTRAPASEETWANTWFARQSIDDSARKAKMNSDANIVCHAYAAQANAVAAFNQYVALCNSGGNYSDCNYHTSSQYRYNVDELKANFQRQENAFYKKYGFTFNDRYHCY